MGMIHVSLSIFNIVKYFGKNSSDIIICGAMHLDASTAT